MQQDATRSGGDAISHEDALAIAAALEEDTRHRSTAQPVMGGSLGDNRATSNEGTLLVGSDDDEVEEEEGEDGMASEMLLPSDLGTLDAEVLSTLPQSLQLEILEKMRDAQVQGQCCSVGAYHWCIYCYYGVAILS